MSKTFHSIFSKDKKVSSCTNTFFELAKETAEHSKDTWVAAIKNVVSACLGNELTV